ncbi:putative glucosylceramidase 4 [Blattella germanica]|nr:putative glucosylceramidase 4 [Blattella germanica]
MGATDFSSHKYSYDDNGIGFSLSNFNLTMEDYEYKIALLKAAKSMSTVPIKIMAAPWTAPKRMLQPISPIQFIYPINKMKSSYYSTYAEYFIK